MTSLDGLDLAALDRHLRAVGVPRSGELQGQFISGGRSNPTFLAFDGAGCLSTCMRLTRMSWA